MNRKDIKYYILSSVLIIVVGFSAIELTTRTVSWLSGKGFILSLHELEPYDKKIDSIYQWHPFTGMILKPNNAFQGGHPSQKERSSIIIDNQGFLSHVPVLDYQKSPNEIRIATIGASTTANINLSYEQNWPGYLGILLQKALPDNQIRIINAGVPGFDTAQSIGNLALRVMPFNPDVVIIYHAYNDLKALKSGMTFQPDYSHIHTKPYGFHKTPNFFIQLLDNSLFYVRLRQKYRDYHQKVQKLEELKNEREGKSKRLNAIPEQAKETFEQHIRTLVSIAKSQGAYVVLSSFATLNDPKLDYSDPTVFKGLNIFQKGELYALMHFTPGLTLTTIFEGINSYNDILKKVAVQEKTGWVDNALLVPHEDKYFVDRVHFSREGGALMGNNFFLDVWEHLKKSQ